MAVTMGDANGVGPEILLRRCAAGQISDDVIVYGDAAILKAGAALLGLDVEIRAVAVPSQAVVGALNVIDAGKLEGSDLKPGQLSARHGAAAVFYVEQATRAALATQVAGVVTLPLNKEAARMARPNFIGHTEFIAQLCGTKHYTMTLATEDIAVAHVSAHVALTEAIRSVTYERVRTVVGLVHRALRPAVSRPRIAVCGLNPHAGENGMFGSEEKRIIEPAIAAERAAGIDVSGPFPADTVFYQAIRRKRFDAIVCMYHDQGHAPMKLIGFETAVNVTIGLPIVRTSVDHGTAFDIAWRGEAFTESLPAALDYAWRLYPNRASKHA